MNGSRNWTVGRFEKTQVSVRSVSPCVEKNHGTKVAIAERSCGWRSRWAQSGPLATGHWSAGGCTRQAGAPISEGSRKWMVCAPPRDADGGQKVVTYPLVGLWPPTTYAYAYIQRPILCTNCCMCCCTALGRSPWAIYAYTGVSVTNPRLRSTEYGLLHTQLPGYVPLHNGTE